MTDPIKYFVLWIKDATPRNWTTIVTASAILVMVLAIGAALAVQRMDEERAVRSDMEMFHDSTTVEARIVSLANLCERRQDAAQAAFLDLDPHVQENMFNTVRVGTVKRLLPLVVRCLQPALVSRSDDGGKVVMQRMCDALARLCAEEGRESEAACGCPQEGEASAHD